MRRQRDQNISASFPLCFGPSGLASDSRHLTSAASARLQVAFCPAHMSPISSQTHLDSPPRPPLLMATALLRERALGNFHREASIGACYPPPPPPPTLQTSRSCSAVMVVMAAGARCLSGTTLVARPSALRFSFLRMKMFLRSSSPRLPCALSCTLVESSPPRQREDLILSPVPLSRESG